LGYREIEGIVLGRRESFDTDQEIYLLTRREGSMQVRAPHAQASQKTYCGRLEPPNLLQTRLYRSRRNSRWTLSQLEIVTPFASLMEHPECRRHLWPLLSLHRDIFPEGEASGPGYRRLIEGLKIMQNSSVGPLLIVDRILVQTARQAGVEPDFSRCFFCDSQRSRLWRLRPGRGLLCERCFDGASASDIQFGDAVRAAYESFSSLAWEEVKNIRFNRKTLVNLESLMYRFFHYHLDISLDAYRVSKSLA